MTLSNAGSNSHVKAVLLMVVAALLWSIAGVVTRQLEGAARFEVTFWRSAFTALSLLVMLPLWRRATRAQGKAKGALITERNALARWVHFHWGLLPASRIFWVSGVCWSVMFTAFMLGLTFTSVANVLIIMAVGPFLTALLSWALNGHKLEPRVWVSIAVAAAGMTYMYGGQLLDAGVKGSGELSNLIIGSLIALCVPIAGALNWSLVQRCQGRGERIDLVPTVLVGAMLSCSYTWALSQPFEATTIDLLWLALLGFAQLALPCMLAMVAARTLSAPEVSLLGLLEVVFGILLPWLFVDEVPGPQVLLGGSVVLLALVANELLGWRVRNSISRIQHLSASADLSASAGPALADREIRPDSVAVGAMEYLPERQGMQ